MAIVLACFSSIAHPSSKPLNFLPTPPHLIRPQLRHATPGTKCDGKIKYWRARASSGREWKEYEDAVQEKDLVRALNFLESLEDLQQRRSQLRDQDIALVSSSNIRTRPTSSLEPGINWMILDACLNAEDMKLVGRTYEFLQRRGFLPNFGKFKNIVAEGPRNVTPAVLKDSTGLEAYLLGCPVRGVILEPLQAVQIGIQGQAGTQFWDETLESELSQGQLSSASFDRYCIVLFAGIAAEALIYGEAQGGESDENLFKAVVSLLRPPWSLSQMSNQARWAVQQSYILLKDHKSAHRAAVKALEKSSSLGFIIRKIEDAMAAAQ